MDRLKKAATIIKTILLVGGVVFIAFLIWGITLMGDRVCDIEIQNNGQRILNIKTIKYTGKLPLISPEKQETVNLMRF